MKIAFIGKFKRLHDEEYIARSFESIGCEVLRVSESMLTHQIIGSVEDFNPDIVLWVKLQVAEPAKVREALKKYKTVCWVFDLYWGYVREHRLKTHPAFTADYVFTTDGGHDEEFRLLGINHQTVRQGIFKEECVLIQNIPTEKVIFVGSENVSNSLRMKQLSFLEQEYGDQFKWYGRTDTNEIRGMALNELYSQVKIVIGDSVYSPNYWSNRIVETLGRGGFLIHMEVPGLKEEYPYLVTYDGTPKHLKEQIDYYLKNEEERKEIVRKNFEWVRDHYTMDKKCQELLNYIS